MAVVFPHLDSVLVERVEREGDALRVIARSRGEPMPCPSCGTATDKVHGYYRRRLADSPAGGAPVILELVLRRLVCSNLDCARQTFNEQVPGLAERYARRTPPLATLVAAAAVALAGRAGSALLAAAGVLLSRTAVLSALMALPEPATRAPEAIGVDDFALKRNDRYATIIINAHTHERLDVLEGRLAVTLEAWLKAHPEVKMICRDRSTAYAAGARDGAPQALQVADRWHVWKNLIEAVEKASIAHRACFSDPDHGAARGEGPSAQRTRSRHAAVHALLAQGASHGQIMRRLHLSRNTVKKYAAAERAEQLIHGPKYSTTLVDPFRDYLRKRRAIEPSVATWTLLGEIKAMGYQGGSTLLYRYLGQGRADGEHLPPTPRRLTRWITTNPAKLTASQQTRLEHTLKRCPELQAVTDHVRSFAALLTADHDGNLDDHTARLDAWIDKVRADQQVPALRSFAEGLLIDHDAVAAALALPYSNGPTEGVVNKIKLLKRQMYGRAGLSLLRKRILLDQKHHG
ncbi:ISL3 family transposase [Nonomuraea sp. NPDC046802]|uniref:ISL3 family transposase n=1 Tax=Nonomuraea sp. NPDC046802 TaxID=3154919 RepID=UPI0033FAB926